MAPIGPQYNTWLNHCTAEDLRFYRGDQWPADVLAQRVRAGRPCLVINRIPEFVEAAMKEQRIQRGTKEHGQIAAKTVREHRDGQVMLNYFASAKAEGQAFLLKWPVHPYGQRQS